MPLDSIVGRGYGAFIQTGSLISTRDSETLASPPCGCLLLLTLKMSVCWWDA